MKTVNKYILALGLLMGSACSKVDDQTPYVAIDPEQIFSDPARIEKAALGMYNALQNAEFFGGRVLIYADQRGNDVNVSAFFGNTGSFNILSGDVTVVLNCWTGGYRTIYEANLFMKKLLKNEAVVGTPKATQYYAEAKFIRALCYFYLVNLYAQPYNFSADASHVGVPLIIDAAEDGAQALSAANKVKRNTVKEVYDQMIKDLTEASAALTPNWNDAYFNRARATKAAADGLLARVYLYKGDWINANTSADAVIASPLAFKLATEPIDNWTFANMNATVERIFSVAMNSADNPNTNNAIGQHYSPLGRGDISINTAGYFALPNFSVTDKRRVSPMIRTSGTLSYTGKYYNNPREQWVPVLRLAEIKLIKAEAMARLDPLVSAGALTQLQDIRTIRGASVIVPPVTQAQLITLILDERRMELAFEGFGVMDFLRTGRPIPARPQHLIQNPGTDYVVLPIPLQETQRNDQLAQNKGY
ncbi:RagB/SusD family nutrient uptake outer membrane protein [Chitinophaga sp. SYP-B3965]|uniref:RagB/SusD family nutrient uptake outer membrane protein n=1 Tax=Chitinophaga sp. SYP-B3965 TaxID=2663120 RepID=UPI001299BC8D|nr:RagB/SusD family nutrient uptake outer membrane protein [Chitinophaga sp. SYP-B3965]MRG46252.1 RagB/SusD family nutrient uptake outer membrane protein [Chitinophaga sp. SYP-B3965]